MNEAFQPGQLISLKVKEASAEGLVLTDEKGNEAFLPSFEVREHPQTGAHIWVGFYEDNGRVKLTMKLDKFAKGVGRTAEGIARGDTVTGRIYNIIGVGAFILTPEGYLGHIPRVDLVGRLQIGQLVEARVTFLREDGRLNLSMRPLKEIGRVTDAEKILELLRREGKMPYGDHSTPEEILQEFGISKKAFKRALGKLLKEGKAVQQQGWTTLPDNR
ncbi:MAG TPA: S1-like domain-containing RNA-binding protein [Bacillota bacterium]|nr:S1-like domain-containing RNA-binding protein [Bacillota bacterium]